MKKVLLLTLLQFVILECQVFGQDMTTKDIATAAEKELKPAADSSKVWDIGGSLALNFGQTYLKSWAGGGQNALSVAFTGLARANYRKGKVAWDNNLILALGGIALFPQGKYSDNLNRFPFRKNQDNLQLTSIGSYQIDKKGKFFTSGLLDFRTQLLSGFDNYGGNDTLNPRLINTRDLVSQFAAPAYLTLSAGITYKPVSWIQMYLSPFAGKLTFVNPAANIFNANGADTTAPVIGATAYGLETPTDVVRSEFGWYFRGNLEKEVLKNVIVKTQIELFGNYLDNQSVDNIEASPIDANDLTQGYYYNPAERSQNSVIGTDSNGDPIYVYDNRVNVDVNWQTWVTFKINKYLQASLEWQLLYDYDVAVPDFQNDGATTYSTRGVQFRQGLNIGVGYVF